MNNSSPAFEHQEAPFKFEQKDAEVVFHSRRLSATSTELIITLAVLPEDMVPVFYVDLHAGLGDRLGFMQFVQEGKPREMRDESPLKVEAHYVLRAILQPETPCPGPLRLLPMLFLAYMPSPNFTEEDIIREP